MIRTISLIVVISLFSACSKPESLSELESKTKQVTDQASLVTGEAVRIATPIVQKGLEVAKDVAPIVKKKIEEGSAALGNANLSLDEVKSNLNAASEVSAPDSNGNLHYNM